MSSSKSGKNISVKPVSLKTVAEYLGLAPATISLVLNDAPGGKAIPEVTRQRVHRAAAELGYRPNHLARALRRQRTSTVGALVPESSDLYSATIMSGADDFLQREGYFNFTVSHRRNPARIEEYPKLLMERAVEGLIMIDTALEHPLRVPVVSVGSRHTDYTQCRIVLDHSLAAKLILGHLYSLGHREIAFMRGQKSSGDAEPRWEALMQAAQALGIRSQKILNVQLELDVASPQWGYQLASPFLGYPAVGQLLAKGRPFTALVCYNDISAIGAIRALGDAGLRVPEDVSVVGFDDIQGANYNRPSLTTIRQPLIEIGNIAARTLLKLIRGDAEVSPRISIMPELIVRESTGTPRTAATVKKSVRSHR